MNKICSKLLILTLIFMLSIPSLAFAAEDVFTIDNHKVRVDSPRSGCGGKNNQWHVHVYGKNKSMNKSNEIGCENVIDQSDSHGKDLSDVPRKTREKIRNHKKYKDAKKKQQQLNKAMKKIKRKKLNLRKTTDIIIAAGIVAAATFTWFFPGDDVAAWGNFLRALA
ncbi:hypothetical protein WG909_06615 [Peptostreptococcaceae bacterium AGR-M142]